MYGKLPTIQGVEPHEVKGEGLPKQVKREKVKPTVYIAERIIGNGSFGVVYKAVQNSNNRNAVGDTVAIKKVYHLLDIIAFAELKTALNSARLARLIKFEPVNPIEKNATWIIGLSTKTNSKVYLFWFL